MFRRVLCAAVATLLVIGCGGSATAPTARVFGEGTPTVAAGRTNDEKTALARENIDIVHCGETPTPDWCEILHRVDGVPDLVVEGTSLFVATTVADSPEARVLGDSMCRAIAAASFDDNAQPIGYRHVHVQSLDPEVFIGDCDVPD